MLQASLDKLELNNIEFPHGFTPAFLAKDSSNVWYVFDHKPQLKGSEWETIGQWYEIGLDASDGEQETPPVCRNVDFEDSLFEIIDFISEPPKAVARVKHHCA